MSRMDVTQSLGTLRFEQERRQFRIALLFAAIAAAVYMTLDLLVVAGEPGRVGVVMTMRAVVLAAVLLIALRLRRGCGQALFRRLVLMTAWLIVGLALVAQFMRQGVTIVPIFFDLLALLGFFLALPSMWWAILPPALLFACGRVVLLVYRNPDMAPLQVTVIGAALLAAVGMGVLIGRMREAAGRREDAFLAGEQALRAALQRTIAELRVLRGILPICAHCRQVRDEEGAWADLESYVRQNSDTEFSHGLCPRCAHQHYPDLFGDPALPAPEQPPD